MCQSMPKEVVSGLDDLLKKFDALADVGKAAKLETAAKAGGLPIINAAVQFAPKLSTNLARSIHQETIESSDNHVRTEIGPGGDASAYAARQEFGYSDTDALGRTYNQPAHPYMRPAYDTKRDEAVSEVKDVLLMFINQAAGS